MGKLYLEFNLLFIAANQPYCIGFIEGVRGYDGKTLWILAVQSVTFEINCG